MYSPSEAALYDTLLPLLGERTVWLVHAYILQDVHTASSAPGDAPVGSQFHFWLVNRGFFSTEFRKWIANMDAQVLPGKSFQSTCTYADQS